jgi:HK97 family phage major capsid protein
MDEVKNPVEEAEKVEATEEVEAVEALKGYVKAEVALGVEKAKSEIEAEILAWKAEQKALAEKKAGIFAEGVSENRVKTNSYLKKLSSAVISGDVASLKELTTGDAGENIVDRELSAEIRHLQTEYGVARREMFAVQLTKNSYDANALVTDVSVSWVAEGNVIPTVRVVLNQEELKLKKLAAIASMSRELLEDQEIDLFAFIATRVAEGFAKAEDRAFFAGEGSEDTTNGGFTGLLFNEDIEEVVLSGALSTLTVEKIYEMIDELPAGAQANAKFYGNRTIKTKIRLLKDGEGRYIYQDPINAGSFATLAGKPWVDVEAMPRADELSAGDGFLLYGDLKKSSILGYKGGIAVDRSNSAIVRNVANNADVNTFTTDREAIRWVSRVGAITILPEAVVVLRTASGS